MPITVKHSKVSTIPDDADTNLVRPSDWNADHTLVGLGTMAEQNANNVNITGGSITGVTGLGDVVGPSSSTDNAIARFDSTTGKLLQNSVVAVGDTGAVTGVTTLAASTSVTTPIVQATNSAGLALRNSAGTTQISMGAGGGDNVTIAVATNINGANAQIDISPTGTGHVHIKPTGSGSLEIAPTNAGTMNNMVIGGTTPLAGSFTNLSVTGTTSFDGSQGTAGQVLTSQGTGNTPTWTTVSGGITGFTSGENTTAPNATVYVDFLQASAAVTNADVAFVAKGTGATLAQVPTSTAAGGNKRGNFATDLQKTRTSASQVASAVNSFIGGGQKNTADGLNSVVVGGNENYALATGSVACGGLQNVSMGLYTFVGGGSTNNADADYSSVIGGINNYANSIGSVALNGNSSFTRAIVGNIVLGSYAPIAASYGNSQGAVLILGAQTTNATATILRSNTSAASATNQVTLPNNSAYFFTGEVISGVTGGGDTKGWTIEGVIKRGANAASTTLVGSTVVSTFGDAGAATWTIALAANTTTGSLNVTFTGQAATTIRTVAQIRTTEMAY